MFDDQNDCQASVGSSLLRGKTARMRVSLPATAGIPSALAPLLIREERFPPDGVPTGRGKNSLTTLVVRLFTVRSPRLLIWTSSVRLSVVWVQAYLLRLLLRSLLVACALRC